MANGHGGRRVGAGRRMGTATKHTRDIANGAVAAGLTPLEFALAVMRDETQPADRRNRMCAMAMPHMHPRLVTTPIDRDGNQTAASSHVMINIQSVPNGSYVDINGNLTTPLIEHNTINIDAEPEPTSSPLD
jgi:hypothetical protein